MAIDGLTVGARFVLTMGSELPVEQQEHDDIEIRGIVDGYVVFRRRPKGCRGRWLYYVEPEAWFTSMLSGPLKRA
jgi:hypothetical protein